MVQIFRKITVSVNEIDHLKRMTPGARLTSSEVTTLIRYMGHMLLQL